MAHKPFLLSLFLLIWLGACDSPQKEKQETETTAPDMKTSEEDQFTSQPMVYDRKADDCANGNCARVILEYPVFDKSKSSNQTLNAEITQILSDFVLEADGDESLARLTEMFLQSYTEFKTAFPESKTPWTIKLTAEVTYRSVDFASVTLIVDSYTGGAQPNSTRRFVNLTPSGKKLDDLSFFFTDENALKALAEKQFRQNQKMSDGEAYSDQGFLFDEDSFSLPENFGFNQTGIVFQYNADDIAPYSEEPLVLTIPYANLGALYRF